VQFIRRDFKITGRAHELVPPTLRLLLTVEILQLKVNFLGLFPLIRAEFNCCLAIYYLPHLFVLLLFLFLASHHRDLFNLLDVISPHIGLGRRCGVLLLVVPLRGRLVDGDDLPIEINFVSRFSDLFLSDVLDHVACSFLTSRLPVGLAGKCLGGLLLLHSIVSVYCRLQVSLRDVDLPLVGFLQFLS